MRAINHALTGAIIGLASGNVWVAAPAAVASHFALDVIPHHNFKGESMHRPIFFKVLVLDFIFCMGFAGLLFYWRPNDWSLAIVCAFLAVAPDFMWFPKYKRAKNGHQPVEHTGLIRFHHDIQWFQRPIGGAVEIAWFFTAVFMVYVVSHYSWF